MNQETAQLFEQVTLLKGNLSALAQENAGLRIQRDIALAKLHSLLPKATPEQEAVFQLELAHGKPGGLATLIAELELSPG